MRKRVEVMLAEREWRDIQRIAKARGMTVAAWVRDALRAAREAHRADDTRKKLDAVRAAAKNAYPTADIGEMLAQIARGYSRDRT